MAWCAVGVETDSPIPTHFDVVRGWLQSAYDPVSKGRLGLWGVVCNCGREEGQSALSQHLYGV